MRVPLPAQPINGGASPLVRVYVVSGLVADARFRLPSQLSPRPDQKWDLALLYMGAAEFGGVEPEPYFVLRRAYAGDAVVVALRIEWEGVFTLLANDDEAAEEVFAALVAPAGPQEVFREWSEDGSTLDMYRQLLSLT